MSIILAQNTCGKILMIIKLIFIVSLIQKPKKSLRSTNLFRIFSKRKMIALKDYWNTIEL
jgi:hypothetical protein